MATLLQKSEQPHKEASTERCVAGPPTLSESSRIQEVDESSYQKEAPRLCRGGSRSLTFQEVVHRRDFQS